MKKCKILILIFFIILSIICIYDDNVCAYSGPKKHILILNSYHHGDKWCDEILEGIQENLGNDKDNVDINIEYMDLKNTQNPKYVEELSNLYTYKFNNKQFDIIISINNEAFDFLQEYSEKLFPKTPVIFCGVNNYENAKIKNNPYFTGVTEDVDIKSTLERALMLHPSTKQVTIMLDKGSKNKINEDTIKNLSTFYGNKVKFVCLNDLYFDQMKDAVREISKDSIIFMATDFKDEYGQYISIKKGIDILSNVTSAPIYSAWDSTLNGGVVGGKMLLGKEHGKIAGNIAQRILKGEKPSDIKVIKDNKCKYIFDFKQLNRFGISQDKLPHNSIIVNKPSLFYNISKKAMWTVIIIIIIGLITTIFVLLSNISERKDAEEALKEKEKLLSTVINSSPNIICFKDEKGRWLQLNEAGINFYKMRDIDYKGKTNSQIAKMDTCFKDHFYWNEYIDKEIWQRGTVYKNHNEIYKSEEGTKILDVIKIPIFNADNSKNGLLFLGRDITEEKRAEQLEKNVEENKRKLNELMEYDKLRTEFFANISHELRTPLNVILGALQLVEFMQSQGFNSKNQEQFIKYTKIMKQNSYRLVRLVNNLIDITKIDAGYFQLVLKNDDIIRVVEDITLSVKEYVESKGLTLIFDTNVEEKIMAFDADKIERIMLNLLSNSIKFTKAGGGIYVNVEDKGDRVIISVKDTGIGIPEDTQKVVFDRFVQVDKSFSRRAEGSGIGLSLVKSLVEMHGGKIQLESKYKVGSKFVIELPANVVGDEVAACSEGHLPQSNIERINIEFSDIYS